MTIFMDSDELLNKVEVVFKPASSKLPSSVSGNIEFDISPNGAYLYATDLETNIKAKLECESDTEAKFVVDAKMLLDIAKVLPSEEKIKLTLLDNLLIIESARSKFKIPTSKNSLPEMPSMEQSSSFEIDRERLFALIKKVIFCAAKDEFLRNLNGVFWEIGNGFLRLVASDGFRLALAEERLSAQSESNFLISLKSMKELQNVLSNCSETTITIQYDGKQLSLSTPDFETVMRVVETDFPNYKRVLPDTFKSKVILSKNDLTEALRRTLVIAKRGSESVKVEVSENTLTLSSKSPDAGEVNEEVLIKKEGEDITTAFNPTYLLESLANIHTDEVELDFVDSTSPLQIKPVDADGYFYIVMPVRLTE